MKRSFIEAINEHPLVFDGAMGTQLYERGVYINRSFDNANLSHQDLVRQIHEDYLQAGAQVLTTNTFAANRITLSKHGLEDKVEAINTNAVCLAKEVAKESAYVAGSMGPTGRTPTIATDSEIEEIRAAYKEQAQILMTQGVDIISLETFRLLSEIRLAIEAIRAVDPELPIVAHMAFDAEQSTGEGASPERVVHLLHEWGADVVGANCVEGPHQLYDVVLRMLGQGVPIIAQPNAGYPRRIEGRLVYMATPEYFGVFAKRYFKAGISAFGGCCGTNPEHIRSVAAGARMVSGGRSMVHVHRSHNINIQEVPEREAVPVHQRSKLAHKVSRVWNERVRAPKGSKVPVSQENFVVSVEVNPPLGLSSKKALFAARMLRDGGVDVINIADGPRASVRMANWALGRQIMEEVDSEVIIHLCGRDRNLLGLQSDVLAYHAIGLHNMVIITGDPPKVGDYPNATAVFDLDSIGILRMVQNLNHGIDPAGKDIGDVTRFFCACGAEPAAQDYERELRRLELKKEAGATMIMTQPVYDPDVLNRFLKDTEHMDLPVLVGLLPLASHRNAEFLHNEVPGMAVPEDVRRRMKAAGKGPQARAEGVLIAQETLREVQDRVVGAYIMPPFGRHSLALKILECIDGYSAPSQVDAEQDKSHG